MKYDVFISHSSADNEIAELVYDHLEAAGYRCWIDTKSITGSYAKSIIEGIRESELFVLVHSEHANRSAHVENEVDNAFNFGKAIIPFKTDKTPYADGLLYYLNKVHYVDGSDDVVEAFDELLKQIKLIFPHKKASQPGNAGRYDLMQNAAGEVLLIIDKHEGDADPDLARLVFDGGDTALVYRNYESAITLNNISPEGRKALKEVEEILIAEIEDDDVAAEYKVPVRIIRKLSLLDD